ncbi:M15 family metallopeptidase [Pseudoduganella albidiflava]|uniref:D-alanyl-D-alanine carboxypeptidase n=1 Tax=Pseudoduganella albidiflava TaxID=321983 RepID=A0A411X146_9BURK|nr:M15 family metallopeptidase [Pseudoduganella albidiflava]QBI02706.1 M15 family peptidase [Pseudoduganella albidiflava]GGY68550.1 D-alanyl-D-alanine carboxypeptidase [Pseudoduganella albidiflava]
MLFVAVTLYFLLACLVSWLLLFPSGRALVLQALAGTGNRLKRGWRAAAQRESRRLDAIGNSSGASLREAGAFIRRHYMLCLGGALLLGVPPLIALTSGEHAQLSGFEESSREVNTQVATLLEGEQLVPPPALPPLAFASAEVQKERPMIASASRDWALLNAAYQQRLLHVFRIMKEQHGYEMAILEGYRSPQRQDALAAMGSSVTNAAAFQSWHQYGLAADCAFVRNGRIVISEKDPWAMRGYQLYGEVAESLGLTWGGRWKMMDLGHTELRVPGVMKR